MTNIVISELVAELKTKIPDFERYNFNINNSNGIITVGCIGVETEGCETDVDCGGKSFTEVIDELVPKVVNLIEICKKKSP